MTKLFSFLAIALVSSFLLVNCTNADHSAPATTDDYDTEVLTKELEVAFEKMFKNVTLTNATEYFKTDVSDDFHTINADGIIQNKEELLQDTTRLKLLEILDFKFFDQIIKVYHNVGIINGRLQAFSEDNYVGEVFYTAIFIKENDIWKYKNWQGTWTKDSPPPPSFLPEN